MKRKEEEKEKEWIWRSRKKREWNDERDSSDKKRWMSAGKIRKKMIKNKEKKDKE